MMDQAPSGFSERTGSDSPKPARPRGRVKARDEKKLTQCEIVRSALEKEIFAGLLAPASPLDEDAIARRFSVSRTPVREALLQLIEAGLVEKPSRQRAVVAPLDVRRLIQMFETLSELEAVCARFAVRRITPRRWTRLRRSKQPRRPRCRQVTRMSLGTKASVFMSRYGVPRTTMSCSRPPAAWPFG